MGGPDGPGRIIDWSDNSKALKRVRPIIIVAVLALETHWRGGGTRKIDATELAAGIKRNCRSWDNS